MATVIYQKESTDAFCHYVYKITGLVNGSNSITLPAPPLAGSFPPAADWTPTNIQCAPYNVGSVGALVTPDLASITNTTGTIAFTLYAAGSTNCVITVW